MANYLKDLPDGFNPGPLDLDKPLDNQIALLKLQADFSGADVQGGFGGQAWAWLPGKENILLFNTYGIGCSRLEYDRDSHSWIEYHYYVWGDYKKEYGLVYSTVTMGVYL